MRTVERATKRLAFTHAHVLSRTTGSIVNTVRQLLSRLACVNLSSHLSETKVANCCNPVCFIRNKKLMRKAKQQVNTSYHIYKNAVVVVVVAAVAVVVVAVVVVVVAVVVVVVVVVLKQFYNLSRNVNFFI